MKIIYNSWFILIIGGIVTTVVASFITLVVLVLIMRAVNIECFLSQFVDESIYIKSCSNPKDRIEFIIDFFSNFLSTVIGLIIAIPIGLAVDRMRKEANNVEIEKSVIFNLRNELSRNLWAIFTRDFNIFDFKKRTAIFPCLLPSAHFISFDGLEYVEWQVIKNRGDISSIKNAELANSLSSVFYSISNSSLLEQRLLILYDSTSQIPTSVLNNCLISIEKYDESLEKKITKTLEKINSYDKSNESRGSSREKIVAHAENLALLASTPDKRISFAELTKEVKTYVKQYHLGDDEVNKWLHFISKAENLETGEKLGIEEKLEIDKKLGIEEKLEIDKKLEIDEKIKWRIRCARAFPC